MGEQKNVVGFGFAHDEIAFRVVGSAVKVLERVGLGVARVVLQTHPWFRGYDLMGQAEKWLGVLVLAGKEQRTFGIESRRFTAGKRSNEK